MPEKENMEPLDELAEVQRRNDEVLSRLAHELRNPLAPLRNGLHILQMPNADGATKNRAIHLMDQQVQKLTRLVDELLDLSRLTRGTLQLRKETVDVAATVKQAVETLRSLLEGQRHQLAVSLPTKPIRVEADPARLVQVLYHLMNNAAKYTAPGGHIHLTVARDGNEVTVSLRDSGIGIAPELLARIFEPFFAEEDRSLARVQSGLGIGLTLVQKFVELMGGRVTAHSDGLGKGSEFRIRLPALAEVSSCESPDCRAETPSPRRPLRVLVVEDSEPIAVMLVTLLEMWGHDVRVATDGPAALIAARTYHPEVVLLDIGLPGMNGYEVAKQLRAEARAEKLLIAAMTGHDREEHRRRAHEAGFDHHLVKPVDPRAVETLLRNAGR